VNISSIFYGLFEAFFYFQFGLVIFLQKNSGTTAAQKMLIKFTTSVIFTSILRAAFSHKNALLSFSQSHEFFLRKNIGAKAS